MNTSRLSNLLLLVAAVAAGAPGWAGAGKLYKWVDDKGQIHYTEVIPPEYKDKGNTEIDKRGRVLRKNDAVSEQQRQSEEEASRKRSEDKRVYEQKRRDTALLKTYTNEAEIDLARDRTLAVPLQALKSTEPRVKAARQRADALRAQAEPFSRAGKPVPEALQDDIATADRELAALELEHKSRQADIDNVRERYAAEKARYRELSVAADKTARTP